MEHESRMEQLTCVVLDDALVLKTQFYVEGTTEDMCERLIEENAMVFEGLDGLRDLRLYLVTPWDPSDATARRRFLNGELTQHKRPIAVDDETPATRLLPANAFYRSHVCVIVEIDMLRALEDSRIVLPGEWFPTRTLHLLEVPRLETSRPFFHVSGLPFGVKIDKPDHVLVRACFFSVFNELVPSVRRAFEDDSATSSRVLVVTGSPGIGKRYFLFYCVFCFLFDDQTIGYMARTFRLVVTARYKTYVWTPAPGIFRRVDDAVELMDLARDSTVLRLVLGDGVDATVSLKPLPPRVETWRGVTIYVANAKDDNRVPLAKLLPTPRKTWILPVWTLQELRVVNETTRKPRRLSTADLLYGFATFGGNIQLVLNLSEGRRKIHEDYEGWRTCPLSKLLALVKRDDGTTQRDYSGHYLHMVPDSRATAGFRLQCASKRFGMVMVARNEFNLKELEAATAFALDPRADVRCDAVKRVLFEMLTCRWLTGHIDMTVDVKMVFEKLCSSHSDHECEPISLRFGTGVFASITHNPLKELFDVFGPGRRVVIRDWESRLTYVRTELPFAECPTVDAIVIDHTQERWFLLNFCTNSDEFPAQCEAVVAAAKAVTQAMPATAQGVIRVIPAMVVPPWLHKIVIKNANGDCHPPATSLHLSNRCPTGCKRFTNARASRSSINNARNES